MEYRIVAKINFLEINKVMNKGKALKENIRLSNSNERFNRHFNTKFFKDSVGTMIFDDYFDSNFIYMIGKDDEVNNESQMTFLNRFLSEIQFFSTVLWLIKDNSVTMEEGIIYLLDNSIDHSTSINSRTVFFSNSRGERDTVLFTDEELDYATELLDSIVPNEEGLESKDVLFQNLEFKLNRIERFLYLIQAIRNESYIPMKIALYTTVLETLLSTSKGSLAHSVAERAAWLISENDEEKIKIFRFIKKMYSIRSSVLHGDKIPKSLKNKNYDDFKDFSEEYDDYIRRIVIKILTDEELREIYDENNVDHIGEYYTNLILNIEK